MVHINLPKLRHLSGVLPVLPTLLLCLTVSLATYLFTITMHLQVHRTAALNPNAYADVPPVATSSPTPPSPFAARRAALTTLLTWLRHMRALHPAARVRTVRLGCREYSMGAQTCVYEGVMCFNVSAAAGDSPRRNLYFVDDTRPDGDPVPSDNWCGYRQYSAEPWYYGVRHWPIREDTVAPQMSCMDAHYRTANSLFRSRLQHKAHPWEDAAAFNRSRIKWLSSLWLMDMEYPKGSHNNDFVIDLYWLLDVQLFQESLDLKQSPALPRDDRFFTHTSGHLFTDRPQHIYTPQREKDFLTQSSNDINRLMWALALQLNTSRLYPDTSREKLTRPPPLGVPRYSASLFQAFPELQKNDRFLFHNDLRADNSTDLVCTARLTAGPKRYDGASERVCRVLRDRGYKLFGVTYPPMVHAGKIFYPRPPRRIIVLQRHISRMIYNVDELVQGLRKHFRRYDVEVELVTTAVLRTAEEFVRVFSRAGVMISSHGSQNMGQIWMPRHSTLIEIMPLWYNNYAFRLLAGSCNIWYHEVQSMRSANITVEKYKEQCARFWPVLLNQCHAVRMRAPIADVSQVVRVAHESLERMGHALGHLIEDAPVYRKGVAKRGKSSKFKG